MRVGNSTISSNPWHKNNCRICWKVRLRQMRFEKSTDSSNPWLKNNYSVPDSLLSLAKKGEKGFLALKIVEIIGEDEVISLDSETIYFITHLLNQLELKEFRNEILGSALPLRI